MGKPEDAYGHFTSQTWQEALQKELHNSGLPGAIDKLTKDLAESARINALLREADTIVRQLRKMSNVHEYVLFLYISPSFDLVLQTKAP